MASLLGRRLRRYFATIASVATDDVAACARIAFAKTRTSAAVTPRFHYAWLRDTCPCPQCMEATSMQRLVFRSDAVHRAARPTQARLVDGGGALHVRWHDAHESVYSAEFLRTYAYDDGRHEAGGYDDDAQQAAFSSASASSSTTNSPSSSSSWTASTLPNNELPRFAYADIMSDADDGRRVFDWLRALLRYGVVIVDGVPSDAAALAGDARAGAVLRVAQRLGDVRRTMYGDSWFVCIEASPINVAYTALPLPPHNDLLYYATPPGVQLLHCLVNDVRGGANTFVDSLEVVRRFEATAPQHAATLRRVYFSFHKRGADHWYEHRRLLIDPRAAVGDRGRCALVSPLSFAPPFMAPLDVAFDDVLPAFEAYAALAELVASPALNYSHRLAPGECVVFNNRRILHSRQPFDPSEGARVLQGAYVDHDALLSTYRVLKRKHGENGLLL